MHSAPYTIQMMVSHTAVNAALLIVASLVAVVSAVEDDIMTFGSVVKFQHSSSKHFLHSHQINWGSGSGQQSVTAHRWEDEQGGMWVIKESNSGSFQEGGTPVACGAVVRLGHLQTARNLHSHFFSSPLSNQQEVSCFGEDGDGDTGDDWEVVCVSAGEKLWRRDHEIRLKHKDTGRFLQTEAKHRFSQKNCPNCPIIGQQEVFCHQTSGVETAWKATLGVFIHPKTDEEGDRDEL